MAMQSIDNVIRFPIEKRIGKIRAEKEIGEIKQFCYPEFRGERLMEWTENFLLNKLVLYGWTSINSGLASCFKNGHVVHRVDKVYVQGMTVAPRVSLACGFNHIQVANWAAKTMKSQTPVVLLTRDQAKYFRLCQKCYSSGS
jgi:hypothetical protein